MTFVLQVNPEYIQIETKKRLFWLKVYFYVILMNVKEKEALCRKLELFVSRPHENDQITGPPMRHVSSIKNNTARAIRVY